MENFFVRYKNPLALMAVLFIQVVGLATQVKRPENARAGNTGSGTRLIRVWTVTAFTPVEKMFVSTGHFFRNGWQNYADLRSVRKQNRDLQEQVARLQMEQVQLRQDADQARRLQTLLDFKEKFVARTVAAQVIGTSGTEQSRVIIIDKGSRDGLKPDMAVITPDGIVGKVKDVFPMSSQVLLINDHDSGAGVILEHSRLQGILKGTPLGELQINDIMSDEKVDAGEHLITSGGDRIYPKGFSVGMVISATPDRDNDPFQVIKIKPSADLGRLEEVIVITKMTDDSQAAAATPVPMRAADILAQRLPSVPKVDPKAAKTPGGTSGATVGGPTPTPVKNKPTGEAEQKPGTGNASPKSTVPAGGAATTPSGTAKSGGEGKKPVTPAQAGTGSATATATPALPKPKPTPRKPKPPTTGTDGATPSASHAPSDQPAAAQPTATPTPATDQEKPPR
jgi:rod shape-determining protein MreC